MAQLDEFNKEVWSDQSIFRVENHIINNIFACRTTDAVEAAITYSAFLRKSGLTNENYPLVPEAAGNGQPLRDRLPAGDHGSVPVPDPHPAHEAPGVHLLPPAHQLASGRNLPEDPRNRAGRPAVRLQLRQGRVQDPQRDHQRREQPGQAPQQGKGPGRVGEPGHPGHPGPPCLPGRSGRRRDGAAGPPVQRDPRQLSSTSAARWKTPSPRCSS